MCLVRAASLFIDSESLVSDGSFLDLAMVDARRFFWRALWWLWSWAGCGVGRWPLASVVAGNPRDRFVFLDFLRFYLHSFHDNHFIPVCLLVSTYVASYNWLDY
jgi:hypothetical protein